MKQKNDEISCVLEDTFFGLKNIGEFAEIILEFCFSKNAELLDGIELRKKFTNAQKLSNALFELLTHEVEKLEDFVSSTCET